MTASNLKTTGNRVKLDNQEFQTISAGYSHSLGIKSDGTLWSWGYNAQGQLGIFDPYRPTQVGSDTWELPVSSLSSSSATLSNLKVNVGNGKQGSWTSLTWTSEALPTDTSIQFRVRTSDDNSTYSDWSDYLTQDLVSSTSGSGDLTSINPAQYLEVALTLNADTVTPALTDFTLNYTAVSATVNGASITYTSSHDFANNAVVGPDVIFNTLDDGQDGAVMTASNLKTTGNRVKLDNQEFQTISAGYSHSLGIKQDGTLWAWGYNSQGQLGLGDTDDRDTPTQVGSDTDWSSVSAGDIHSLGLKQDGTLWAWGYNGQGQLGIFDFTIIHQLGSDTWAQSIIYATSGTLSDMVINAGDGLTVNWGHLSWSSEPLPANTSIKFRVRTSSDGNTYSDWSDDMIQSELDSTTGLFDLSAITPSQYIEIALSLISDDTIHTPILDDFTIDYVIPSEPLVIVNIQSIPHASSLTITWDTTTLGSSQVNYGQTNSYGSSTIESDTDPRVFSHTVALSNLNGCTAYHYQVGSKDNDENSTTSSDNVAATTGCGGGGGGGGFPSPAQLILPPIPTPTLTNPTTTPTLASSTGNSSAPHDGNLVLDHGVIYVLENGLKSPIASMKVFLGLGYNLSQVVASDTSNIPEGLGILTAKRPHSIGSIVIDQGTVYLLAGTTRNPFPSEAVFKSWGFSFNHIVTANSFDLALPVGSVLGMK